MLRKYSHTCTNNRINNNRENNDVDYDIDDDSSTTLVANKNE